MNIEAERLASELESPYASKHSNDAAALLRKLVAENEALKADAARYRWLRNEARTVDWSCHIQVKAQPKMVAYQPNCRGDGQQMDAAIDEAIKQGEKQ